jgi:hypothetical protein
MKIKVVAKKINPSTSDWAKKTMQLVLNKSAESIAKQMSDRLKGFECEIHKSGSRGIITVTPNINKNTVEFSKSNFCCKEFSDRIDLT